MSNIRTSDEEADLVALAQLVLPGGTFGNTPSRTVLREGRGSHVWDVSGNEYVDYLLGSGPMFIGHAHPEVTRAVIEQVGRGSTFFANNEHGIRLAAAIVDAVACADQVRFVSSGSEADAYAMRLARAYRRRDKILKFEGGYHGMSDHGLMSLWPTRPGNSARAVPDSAGIPAAAANDVLVAPYNDLEAVRALVQAHHEELAGIIVEPMQRLVPPVAGFLQGLRDICTEFGLVLIFDEVVTGFRLSYGGGQAYYGVTPDVCTLGKIIGGGFPLAAVAGRAEIMAHFDRATAGDNGFMPQVGTLSGNPVAAVAGLATLEVLRRPGAYETVFATGRTLMAGMRERLAAAGVTALVLGEPPMFDAVFTRQGRVTEYWGTVDVDRAVASAFNAGLRERGIFKSESKMYLSLAHDERDVAQTLDAVAETLRTMSVPAAA